MPERVRMVIDALSRDKYPDRYEEFGIIRACAAQYRLREGIADVTTERLKDPHVQFFVERNPGHGQGDELCCLAPLSRDNFTDAAYRVLGIKRSEGSSESAFSG